MTDLLKFCDGALLLVGGLPPHTPTVARRALRGVEAALIEEARTWLGTPFRHQGRIRGVGCDCLGLLIGVAKALDLQGREGQKLAEWDSLAYGHFPNEETLWGGLSAALYPTENLAAGCIVLMAIDGRAQHLGIVGVVNQESRIRNQEKNHDSCFMLNDSETLTLIHAYAPHRKVVEHRLSEEWQERIVGVFRSCNSG